MRHLNLFFTILFLLLFYSCKNEIKNEKNQENISSITKLKYAKGFEIQHFPSFKKLIIKAPYQNATDSYEFILVSKKDSILKNSIEIPLKSVVVTSTTHIPMLEVLNIENTLVGFPNSNYVSSEKTRKLIDNGNIAELGNEENINTELLLQLQPQLVIGFSINSNSKMFESIEKIGIPVLLNGDWLEDSPLGRTEWIKVFGVLFNKEKEADSIFDQIEKNYLLAKELAKKTTNKPTILSGGLFNNVWNLPAGNSFEATFLADANTDYLWKETKGKGSLSLNIENVFEKGKDATIWISPSYFKTLNELKNNNVIYNSFVAVKNEQVYSYVNSVGKTGGLIYFELAPTRPDLVLKDIIKIAHPQLMTNYNFTFYSKLK